MRREIKELYKKADEMNFAGNYELFVEIINKIGQLRGFYDYKDYVYHETECRNISTGFFFD